MKLTKTDSKIMANKEKLLKLYLNGNKMTAGT